MRKFLIKNTRIFFSIISGFNVVMTIKKHSTQHFNVSIIDLRGMVIFTSIVLHTHRMSYADNASKKVTYKYIWKHDFYFRRKCETQLRLRILDNSQ